MHAWHHAFLMHTADVRRRASWAPANEMQGDRCSAHAHQQKPVFPAVVHGVAPRLHCHHLRPSITVFITQPAPGRHGMHACERKGPTFSDDAYGGSELSSEMALVSNCRQEKGTAMS